MNRQIVSSTKELIGSNLEMLNIELGELSDTPSVECILSLLNLYKNLFHHLFDRDNPNNFVYQLNHQSSMDDINFLLSALALLKNSIKSLPVAPEIKQLLLSKMNETLDLDLLSKYEHVDLDDKNYQIVLNSIYPKNLAHTVELRTWGTTAQLDRTGLKNILRQKLTGEGVGHASLTMRIKCDNHGDELIKKYCLNEDGSKKIPFEIKKYGDEVVYEVYWSFWPGQLNTFDDDVRDELASVEYSDDDKLLQKMPLELKQHYVKQKYVRVPLSGRLTERVVGHSLFGVSTGSSRVMAIAPTASLDFSQVEPDEFRRRYLLNYLKVYELDNELKELSLLTDNYLETDGKLSPNFFILLKRFQKALYERSKDKSKFIQAYHDIGRTHQMTESQRELMKQLVHELKDDKVLQKSEAKQELLKSSDLLQTEGASIENLRDELKALDIVISISKSTLETVKHLLHVFEDVTPEKTKNLIDKDLEAIDQLNKPECFPSNPEVLAIFGALKSDKQISFEQVSQLKPALSTYQLIRQKCLTQEITGQHAKQSELLSFYQTTQKERLKIVERQLETHIQEQKQNDIKMTELQQLSIQLTRLFDVLNKIKELNTELKELQKKHIEPQLQKELLQQLKDYKRLLAEYKKNELGLEENNFSYVFDFSYVDENGQQSLYKIKSIDDLTPIKEELERIQGNHQKSISSFVYTYTNLELGPPLTPEELAERRIQRGTTNKVYLQGFDVEQMLERASLMLSDKREFDLSKENCSTTCTELLNAGAPEVYKHLFVVPKIEEDEEVAVNVILPNPQSVFVSGKLVELDEKGNPLASQVIHQAKHEVPSHDYNKWLNQNIALASSHRDDPRHVIKSVLKSILSLFVYGFRLVKELTHSTPSLPLGKTETLSAKVARNILQFNQGQYAEIERQSPALAMVKMLQQLKKDPSYIPFFSQDTLSRIERYKFESDKAPLIYQIIAERDARIQCIEHAIMNGVDCKQALNNRSSDIQNLEWPMTREEKFNRLMDNVLKHYQRLRANMPWPSTLIPYLNQYKDNQEIQMQLIIAHVKEHPEGRAARALHQTLIDDPILYDKDYFPNLDDPFEQTLMLPSFK